MADSKENILVIDDEAGIRQGCIRVLKPEGFNVVQASSLEDGLRKIQENDFDLVLLDVMLPDGRGIDLLAPIQKKDPDLVCIIITGFATIELAVEAIKAGAYNFISKPFTADVLLMSVNQGLDRRRLALETHRLQTIEQEAENLVRAKEEAERLSEFKTDFTLMIAHELRSPIGGAQSLVRTLIRGLPGELNEQQREILIRVNARLDGLLALINDLLTLASAKKIEVDQPLEPIRFQPIIEQIVDHFRVDASEKQITLAFEIPDEDAVVMASEDGLGKIFGNLISNAIKYTSAGGEVTVKSFSHPNSVEVQVSDTGIGIPEDALPMIGDEFFRAPNAKITGITGTGLGLSIVKQYVKQLGGNLNISSKVGAGTTCKVTLRKGH